MIRLPRTCIACASTFAWVASAAGASSVPKVPLAAGVTIVTADNTPDGDRESVITIAAVDAEGVRYKWDLTEISAAGTKQKFAFSRLVRTEDLKSAKSMDTVFRTNDPGAKPGTTSFSISTAVYDTVLASGSASYDAVYIKDGGALYMSGTLTLTSPNSVQFPVLLNGQRVSLPSIKMHARFTGGGFMKEQDFLVLADRAYPLVVKISQPRYDLQTVRIDVPREASGSQAGPSIEQALTSDCRAELSGVYFAFGTALLDDASNKTLTDVAGVLSRHSEWTVSLEGHTDNVGGDADNQKLSEARATAVREYLVGSRKIGAPRISAKGFGESNPRESNDTLEGRARNRRVELVRACSGK